MACCEWALRDACVAYEKDAPQDRRVLLMQRNGSNWVQRHFPGEFREGSGQPFQGRTRDEPRDSDAALLGTFKRTWHSGRVGFVVDATMDNMWHVLFHAIPTRERFHSLGLDSDHTDMLPRYTIFWPVGNARELYRTESLKPVAQWPGWETLVRSILGEEATQMWTGALQRTQQLIVPRRWQCYDTLYGGHTGWWPRLIGRNYSGLFAARPSMRAFREAVMRSIGPLERPPTDGRIVFELRDRSRVILNQNELIQNVTADPSLAPRLAFVSLAQLPIVDQLKLVGTSSGFAGAHGAALAMTAFLPSTPTSECSVLEIFPRRMTRQRTHAW